MKIKYLNELDKILKKNNISKKDICVVGSALLALYNLRENNDIDIIMRKNIRDKKFPSTAVNLSKNVELVSSTWFFCDKSITDDRIINDSQYHTVYNGYKFVKLPLLKERKIASNKEKDLKDIFLIEKYYES